MDTTAKQAVVAVFVLIAFLVAVIYGMSTSSRAQEGGWLDQSLKSSCEWRTGRECKYRPKRRPRTVVVVRRPVYDDYRTELPRDVRSSFVPCKSEMIKAVSNAAVWGDAVGKAKQAWRQMVISKYGEVYMTFDKARFKKVMCWGAETGERWSDKVTDHLRCEASGIPCFGAEIRE